MQLFAPPIPNSAAIAETAYREADHRAKNSIQLAISMLQLQAREAGSAPAAYHLQEASRRLAAIAAAHELCGDHRGGKEIAVDRYLGQICSSVLSGERVSFEVSAEQILLPPWRAIPLGLVASEAITNALRHAFSGSDEDRILINLRREPGNQLVLVVEDNGRGRPVGGTQGLGTELIEGLAKQLQGKVAFGQAEKGGCTVSLQFPACENQHPGAQTETTLDSSRVDFLRSLAALFPPHNFHAGECILNESASPSNILMIVDGIAATHQTSTVGKRRIIGFHFAGDVTNLQCYLGPVPYGVSAVIDCSVSRICPTDLDSALATHPEFFRALWGAAILETSILKQWVQFSGHYSAAVRVAHLLCEFVERYKAAGFSQTDSLPLTQVQIAEACGLSTIHVNRILRQFRPLGIGIFAKGRISISDVKVLHRLCRFRREYLYSEDADPASIAADAPN